MAITTSNTIYWEKRQNALKKEVYKNSKQVYDDVLSKYDKSIKNITKDLESLYGKFGNKDEVIKYQDLAKNVSGKELYALKVQLKEALKTVNPDNIALVGHINKILKASTITTLEQTNLSIQFSMNDAGEYFNKQFTEFGKETIDTSYNETSKVLTKINPDLDSSRLKQSTAQTSLNYEWSGKSFSTRIWEDTEKLSQKVYSTITTGINAGDSIKTMTKKLQAEMESSAFVADRIIRTETTYFIEEGNRLAYEDAGIEKYMFMAVGDERTSQECLDLDGEVIPLKDAQAGVNFPPLHPNCRSTTIPVF